MPRRKPKTAWKEGQSGNPNGRPIGSTNQINNEIRDAFAMLLKSQIPNLQDWLNRAAQRDPIKALDLFTKISERFVPSLQRTEITGADGEAFAPITINLPSIPQFNVPASIGEAAPTALIASPAEEVKAIGEGTPTESTGTFQIPKFELSPNILRDIQDSGEASPE
jgi:hypothetical protein